MLENPITIKSMERRESEDRGRKKRKRRSKKMNARERRKMKIFDIPKSACTWYVVKYTVN